MALLINDKFAPRANPGDTNYPNGSIKNESVPGAKDGTPLDADWGNDYAGGDAALFAEVGITPNGTPDTALNSQRLDALKLLNINDPLQSVTFKTVALMKANTIVLPVGKKVFWQGYYAESDGGSNWGTVTSGAHTDNGGSVFTLADGKYVKANVKSKIYPKKWGLRTVDAITYEEENSTAIESIIASYTSGGTLVLPLGTTVIKRAIQPVRGWTIKGASRNGATLKRFNTTAELLDGVNTTAIVYIKDTWVDVRTITIAGDITAKNVDGIAFNNASPPSQLNFTSIDITGCNQAFRELLGLFMATFRNVNVASCNKGFIFDSNNGKTSLHFTSCYASSIDYQPWQFVQTTYSSLSNTGADVVNTLSKNTILGIYDFFICSMTMDNCGSENNNFGNGVVRAKSSQLVINGLTSFGWGTEYLPDYGTTPNYALGPIQCDGDWNSLVISQPRIEANQPIDHAGVGAVATLLAFNSTDTVRNSTMVNFTQSPDVDANSIKGQGDFEKYVITSEQTRDAIKYSPKHQQIVGTGTVITLPIVAQSGANRKHMINVKSIAGNFSGTVVRAVEASIAFVSLNTISDLSSWGLNNAVVTSSGMNIVITLPFITSNPLISVEVSLSEQDDLISYNSMTLT